MVKAKPHPAALGALGFMLSLLMLVPAFEALPAYPGGPVPLTGPRQKSRIVTFFDEPRKWLNEEVSYIITGEERAAFRRLTTDEERESFIEQFWERRNPYPGVLENLFKERFYRRIAYTNERFSSTVPGWKTDRGRIFIVYGFPDEIEPHPSGGTPPVADEHGNQQSVTFPFEVWRYRCIEGVGRNITAVFVDPTAWHEFHLLVDPNIGDPFEYAHRTQWHFGLQSQEDLAPCGNESFAGRRPAPIQLDRFTKVDVLTRTELSDLSTVLASHLSHHQLPFKVRADSIPLTNATVLVPVMLEVRNPDLQFEPRGDAKVARLKVFGEFSTLSGRIVEEFARELSLEIPESDYPKHVQASTLYEQLVPLPPGIYRLTVVLKDVASGRAGLTNLRAEVPPLQRGVLCASSLILADSLESQPKIQDYARPYALGDTELRPNINHSFARGQTLRLYLQIHNLAFDANAHKPSLAVTYEILQGSKVLLSKPEDIEVLNRAMAILTLRHGFLPKPLVPGRYILRVKANDRISKHVMTASATFEVR